MQTRQNGCVRRERLTWSSPSSRQGWPWWAMRCGSMDEPAMSSPVPSSTGVGCTTGKDGPEHDLGWWYRTSPTQKRLMGWLAAMVLLILVLLVFAIVIA